MTTAQRPTPPRPGLTGTMSPRRGDEEHPSSGAASGASVDLRLRSVVVAGSAGLGENAEGSEAEGEGAMSRRREAHLGLEICKYIPVAYILTTPSL